MEGLFEEFPALSRAQWEAKVRKDLKTEDVSGIQDQQLFPGLIQPAYCDKDQRSDRLKQYRNITAHGDDGWQGARYWANVQQLPGKDPQKLNEQALAALKGGADGIEWVTKTKAWSRVISGISLPHCLVALDSDLTNCEKFMGKLVECGQDFQGYLIIEELISCDTARLADLVRHNPRNGQFRCLTLKENSNGDSMQEISYLLTQAVTMLNALMDEGCPLELIAANFQVQVTLGDHYLWEMCRLRALRILFHQIMLQYGYNNYLASDLMIKAQTKVSPELGMLQNTTQAMSAILGGCNILSTMPHEEGSTSDMPARVARNVSHILREESHFHQVADPIAGSYYLESLIEQMCRHLWTKVQKIESSGGYLHAKPVAHG